MRRSRQFFPARTTRGGTYRRDWIVAVTNQNIVVVNVRSTLSLNKPLAAVVRFDRATRLGANTVGRSAELNVTMRALPLLMTRRFIQDVERADNTRPS